MKCKQIILNVITCHTNGTTALQCTYYTASLSQLLLSILQGPFNFCVWNSSELTPCFTRV